MTVPPRPLPLLAILAAVLAAGLLASPAPAQNGPAPASRLDPLEASRLAPRAPRAPQTGERRYDPDEAQRFRVLRGALTEPPAGEESLKIKSLEGFIDYDEEEEIFYGPGRTQIWYEEFYLEADKVVLDNRLKEVQAEGNVVLRIDQEEYSGAEFRCDSLRFNFEEFEGVAFGAVGEYPPVFFKSRAGADGEIPPLQQVSRQESLFRNAEVTTCDFKVPHYAVRAKEVILFLDDRIFFRGALLRVWDVPVFYFPYLSRSLKEKSPWFFQFGGGTSSGFRMRVGYEYRHQSSEPSIEDEDEYVVRSQGRARTFVDYLSERGFGAGAQYRYNLDFGKHVGVSEFYGISDEQREISNTTDALDDRTSGDPERWQALWRHRTEFSKHLYGVANVDWFSDSEIFYDILDRFQDSEFERQRQIERRARGALTYLREAYTARLVVELKDRVGIDRYNDFSDPRDNDLDFEFDPFVALDDSEVNSVARDRWGRVSERLPEATFATRYLPFRRWPIYLLSRATIYNNLDKGLNVVDSDDDARVAGIDTYNQLLWQYRITERYVLLSKLGFGVGAAERDSSDLGISIADLDPEDGILLEDDDGTFIVGRERFNLDDIEPFYAYGDGEIRLNARFTDSLTGFLLWRIRETTDDFIGDFYARIGDRTSRGDLYDYALQEHWVQGNLSYFLVYPRLHTYANAAWNLKNEGDRFPNEKLAFWNFGAGWANRRGTLNLGSSIGGDRYQIFHPSDPDSGVRDTVYFRADARYRPLHKRWYLLSRYEHNSSFGDKVERPSRGEFTLFTDEEDRNTVEAIYGRELGRKWRGEIQFEWDDQIMGLREMSLLLQRDLHDAYWFFRLRSRRDVSEADSREDNAQETDFSVGLTFKLPGEEEPLGRSEVRSVGRAERAPQLAY